MWLSLIRRYIQNKPIVNTLVNIASFRWQASLRQGIRLRFQPDEILKPVLGCTAEILPNVGREAIHWSAQYHHDSIVVKGWTKAKFSAKLGASPPEFFNWAWLVPTWTMR